MFEDRLSRLGGELVEQGISETSLEVGQCYLTAMKSLKNVDFMAIRKVVM